MAFKWVCLLVLGTAFGTNNFVQLGLDIDGEAAGDNSGHSVSISSDGSRVAVGAPLNGGSAQQAGLVRVYELQSGVWTQLGADIDGEAMYDEFGCSVSISGDGSRVAAGARLNAGAGAQNSYSGHVRVYELQSGVWTQLGADIDGESANGKSGYSVSLSSDGKRVAVGAPFYTDLALSNYGKVRVYHLVGSAPDPPVWRQLGDDIDGEAADDKSGMSVSLSSDGSRLAVGAPAHSGDTGCVRVYELQMGAFADVWAKVGSDITSEASSDYSGASVSISSDGSRVAVGAPLNEGTGAEAGHVRVYELQSGAWTQLGADIDGEAMYDQSGCSVSLSADGSRVAVGAEYNSGAGNFAGHVRVYELQSGVWAQLGDDMDGEAAGDLSGHSVALSSDGSRVAAGAPRNAGTGLNAGHVRVYERGLPTSSKTTSTTTTTTVTLSSTTSTTTTSSSTTATSTTSTSTTTSTTSSTTRSTSTTATTVTVSSTTVSQTTSTSTRTTSTTTTSTTSRGLEWTDSTEWRSAAWPAVALAALGAAL